MHGSFYKNHGDKKRKKEKMWKHQSEDKKERKKEWMNERKKKKERKTYPVYKLLLTNSIR